MSKKVTNIASKQSKSKSSKSAANVVSQPTLTESQVEKIHTDVEKVLDPASVGVVDSSQMKSETAMTPSSSTNTNTATTQEKIMETQSIVLTRDNKARRSKSIVYRGAGIRGAVRIAKSAFQDGNPPEQLTVVSDVFAQPKSKETKEERKARLAAAPKLTLAEKIAKREAALAKDREKLAKQQAAAAAPAPVGV